MSFLLTTSSSAYLHSHHYIVESPMGTEDLDNNFWWAESLNRVNPAVEEGLPIGHAQKW